MKREEYNAMRAQNKAAGRTLNAAVVKARRELRKQEAARKREAAAAEQRRKAEERAESSQRRQADARALVLTLVRSGRASPPPAPPADGQQTLDVADAPDVAGYAMPLADLVARWPVSRSMLDRAIEQLCASEQLVANRERDHSTTLIIPRSLAAV